MKILINCDGISKAFGRHPLFETLSFILHEGDHAGLVGPNGSGKSTLLKILAGLETPDNGECTRCKNVRVGYVPQHPRFDHGRTAMEIVTAAVGVDGPESSRRVSIALGKTGFTDQSVEVATLSGGWRTRLALACALAQEPDLLLLDEPTNHLDLDGRLWLESLLAAEPRGFVVVSHDRYFLQNVATRMIEIDRIYTDGLLAVDGTYADMLEARDEILSQQYSYRASLHNRVRREIEWLRRGPKARTSKSRARIDAAYRSMEELKEVNERSTVSKADIGLSASGRKTKRLWYCNGLKKSFDERKIVDDLELLLAPGIRLGVLGSNGSGKTTLLKMIVGELQPDAGEIRQADNLRTVYFDQSRESVDPTLSLQRALAPDGDSVVYRGREVHVVSWAKRFLFHREQLVTPVSELSGGERARIILARLMLQPADLLVLDEPTNDLDIPTLDLLEESLLEFPGALVLVTHDRHLLDRVTTELLALDGTGGTERFADYMQWRAQRRQPTTRKKKKVTKPRQRRTPKKLSYLEQREWDGIEETIMTAEAKAEQARCRLEDPEIATDPEALQRLAKELEEAQVEVDRIYTRWAELEEKIN